MKKVWTKRIPLGRLFFTVLISLWLFGCSQPVSPTSTAQVQPVVETTNAQYQSKVQPDKIEIIEFHNTQRCATCIKAGELLKRTVDEKFADEVKSWLVSFKEVNVDLPENSEIAYKYQAGGLSVFINTVISWKDNIEQDMNWWRLVSNDEQYIQYFEGKINALLGK